MNPYYRKSRKQTCLKSNNIGMNRREFMKSTGISAAAMMAPISLTSLMNHQPPSKSGRPSGAVVGLGKRGKGMVLMQFPPYTDLLAICDVDQRRLDSTAQAFYEKFGRKIDTYTDYRKLLERKDIHFIANATPEHWHTKITIDACRAGKDVYLEKPMTLTIDEGKILRRVVKETNRIVQVGTQQRSGMQFQIVSSMVRNGRLGKLKQVGVYLPVRDINNPPFCESAPVPEGLDWEFWLGQAPKKPYCEVKFNRPNAWWDYGGGIATNWGAHHIDIALWGIGENYSGPELIETDGYAPNRGTKGYPRHFRHFTSRLTYPDDVEMWCMTVNPDDKELSDKTKRVVSPYLNKVPESIRDYNLTNKHSGVLFIGEKGRIFVGRNGAVGEEFPELDRIPLQENGSNRFWSYLYEHTNNFVRCMDSRQQPVCSVPIQQITQLPCHLINISLQLGRKLEWDSEKEEFIGDNEANGYLSREQREPYAFS